MSENKEEHRKNRKKRHVQRTYGKTVPRMDKIRQ
jgi:hypothetical protein